MVEILIGCEESMNDHKKKIRTTARLLIVAVILCGCFAAVSALPEYTATFSPSGGVISPGTQITIAVNGIHQNDNFKLSSSGSDLLLSTSSYSLNSVYLPFALKSGQLSASVSTLDPLTIAESDPDGYIKSFGPTFPASQNPIINGTYGYITLTGPSTLQGKTVNLDLYIQGIVSDAAPPADSNLVFTIGGASQGTVTIQVLDGATTVASATYTLYTPTPVPGPTYVDSDIPNVAPAVAPVQLAPPQQPQLGPTQALIIVTSNVTTTGTITSGPIVASPEGMPNVVVTWTTSINSTPLPNATIRTSILQTADASTLAAYQAALARQGLNLTAIAYVMDISKSGISGTGPATITMTVPQSWIDSAGGITNIVVVHMADDGSTEVLSAQITGTDSTTGYVTLSIPSPNGLSSFALVSVQSVNATTTFQAAPTTQITTSAAPVSKTTTRTPVPAVLPVAALGFVLLMVATRPKSR